MNAVDTIMGRSVEQAQQGVVSLRFGRVKQVTGDTVTVTLGGIDVPNVSVLSSYTPKANDWAWLLRQGSLLVAIGCSKGNVLLEDKDA